MYDDERLLAFKRKFMTMANKCLADPALVTNRELVKLFVGSLDRHFRDNLDSRLSLKGQLHAEGTVRGEDPYDWKEVVSKAVELVSNKTIAKALRYDTPEKV